jgi:hypothetical protein
MLLSVVRLSALDREAGGLQFESWNGTEFYILHQCMTLVYPKTYQLTQLLMKNGVLWDVTPCDSCMNRRFGGT